MDRTSDRVETMGLAPKSPGQERRQRQDARAESAARAAAIGSQTELLAPVILSVLAGRQAGAAIELESGAVLLGSEAHCEIVLRDEGIQAEHLLFSVRESQIDIRVLAAGVKVNGRRLVAGQVVRYRPGTLLEFGAVTVGLAPRDFDWAAAMAEPAEPTNGPGAAPTGAGSWMAAFRARPRRGLAVGGTAAAVMLALALVAAATAGGFGQHEPTLAERESAARHLVSGLGLAEIGVETAADGRLQLAGYVPDQRALHRLRQAAAEQNLAVKAYPVSELTRFAAEWLGSRDLKAQVNYLGAGALEVVGQDSADRRLSAAAERLALEVPGVSTVRQRIAPPVVAEVVKPPPAEPDPYVLGGVNGVNPGHPVPYISSGQSYIFSGGALKNGMTVMAIEPERVVVDDHGRKLTSEIQVR